MTGMHVTGLAGRHPAAVPRPPRDVAGRVVDAVDGEPVRFLETLKAWISKVIARLEGPMHRHESASGSMTGDKRY